MEQVTYRNIKEIYKIEKIIGKGSFATVRKCKNRETGEYFAVKIFSKKKMIEEDITQLSTEIEILKKVDHPGIVNMIDLFEDEGHFCIILELMKGGELFEEIINKKWFTEKEAR